MGDVDGLLCCLGILQVLLSLQCSLGMSCNRGWLHCVLGVVRMLATWFDNALGLRLPRPIVLHHVVVSFLGDQVVFTKMMLLNHGATVIIVVSFVGGPHGLHKSVLRLAC